MELKRVSTHPLSKSMKIPNDYSILIKEQKRWLWVGSAFQKKNFNYFVNVNFFLIQLIDIRIVQNFTLSDSGICMQIHFEQFSVNQTDL